MTLTELKMIQYHITSGNPKERPKSCGVNDCATCKREIEIYDILIREIKLKTFDPNDNSASKADRHSASEMYEESKRPKSDMGQ